MDADSLTLISRTLNGVVLAAIGIGVWLRFRTRTHMAIMIGSMIVDVANVLIIELSRGAIEKAIDTSTKGGEWLLKFHIAVSVASLALYGTALYTGIRIYRGGKSRAWHRRNAVCFLVCRVANFITSFGL